MASLDDVVKRLEAAALRLESLVKTSVPGAAVTATSAPASSSSAAGGPAAPAVTAFEELRAARLAVFLDLASRIGGPVDEQAKALAVAFDSERDLIATAAASKKPEQSKLQELLTVVSNNMQGVIAVKDTNRASPNFNHLSMVAEGVGALGWVAVVAAPGLTPVSFVGEMNDASRFYSQRILKEYKDKDKTHVEYAQAFGALLTDLQAYIKQYHTTGLSWNPKGGDAVSHKPSAPAAQSSPAAPAGPDPSAIKGLFSALNKDGLTSALKKVDKSEMTHKNPALRATSVVPAQAEKAAAAPKPAAAGMKGPPKLELQGGNKWIVENYSGVSDLVLDKVDIRHAVYIYNCHNCAIQIKGKVNAVTIDNCKKTGVVVESVVSSIEVINCQSSQVQILNTAAIVVVDKTDGLQVYISKESAGHLQVFSAKSSAVNMLIEGDGEDGGFIELPVPERLKTVYKDKKLISTLVDDAF